MHSLFTSFNIKHLEFELQYSRQLCRTNLQQSICIWNSWQTPCTGGTRFVPWMPSAWRLDTFCRAAHAIHRICMSDGKTSQFYGKKRNVELTYIRILNLKATTLHRCWQHLSVSFHYTIRFLTFSISFSITRNFLLFSNLSLATVACSLARCS